jgi:transposase
MIAKAFTCYGTLLVIRRRAGRLAGYLAVMVVMLHAAACCFPFCRRGLQDGVVMSVAERPWPDVPGLTAQVARAAFPGGSLAMRVRDELGPWCRDADFSAAYGARGRPGLSPAQLAVVTVLQFAQNLTDRQAADAVRGRIDWKYCLGLDLADQGFDFSVLSEFRGRLVAGGAERLLLDLLLAKLRELGLVRAGMRHLAAGLRAAGHRPAAAGGHGRPGGYCGPGPDFPDGHFNVHVAVQGRKGQSDLFGLVPGDETPAWELDCVIVHPPPETDLRGPQIQGSPGKRFIYLSSGVVDSAADFRMFRRAKLWLDTVSPDVIAAAIGRGELAGRLCLSDAGWPVGASIRPPRITWSAT